MKWQCVISDNEAAGHATCARRIAIPAALMLAAAVPVHAQTPAPFRELRCTGVPDFPTGKTVRLDPGQIYESASAPMISFVELDGATGVTYYSMSRNGPRRLTGEATAIISFDWSHRTAKVACTIVR